MRKRIAEQSILFFSVLKWSALSTLIGVIVACSTTLFLLILNSATSLSGRFEYTFLLLPLAFLASVLLTRKLAPDAAGHGTEKVIEALHANAGRINPLVVPVKLAATIITLATGGSAGKEGPCAQIGAGISSGVADILRFPDVDRRKLVICGISAGFASVFGTPLAGAIFGVEVLFVGSLMYDVLLPSFISGLIAFQVSSNLGVHYFHDPIVFHPVFTELFFLKIIFAGIFFGLIAFAFIEFLKFVEAVASGLTVSPYFKAVFGGAVLTALGVIFGRRYLGLGLDSVESALLGGQLPWTAPFIKMLFTSVTLGFGGSGGIVTPIFFIGSSSGTLFSALSGLDPATCAALGMVGLLAGCANTPIAASIMAVELFGPALAPYAALVCVISFLMTGHRSVYPSQVLSVSKSASIHVELGEEMDQLTPVVRPRARGAISIIRRLRGPRSNRPD